MVRGGGDPSPGDLANEDGEWGGMENGMDVAHLVMGHPSCLSFSYLSCPLPPSLPHLTLPWDHLPAGVLFIGSLVQPHDTYFMPPLKIIARTCNGYYCEHLVWLVFYNVTVGSVTCILYILHDCYGQLSWCFTGWTSWSLVMLLVISCFIIEFGSWMTMLSLNYMIWYAKN
jgi:hypothetical protein